jgi:hypothetical protein
LIPAIIGKLNLRMLEIIYYRRINRKASKECTKISKIDSKIT